MKDDNEELRCIVCKNPFILLKCGFTGQNKMEVLQHMADNPVWDTKIAIAKTLSIDERAVRNALEELCDKGYLNRKEENTLYYYKIEEKYIMKQNFDMGPGDEDESGGGTEQPPKDPEEGE